MAASLSSATWRARYTAPTSRHGKETALDQERLAVVPPYEGFLVVGLGPPSGASLLDPSGGSKHARARAL
jgi:hypothetical protein